MNKLIAILATILTLGCSSLLGEAKTADVAVPIGCADGLDLIIDATEVAATTPESELFEALMELAKSRDKQTVKCAADLYVMQQGGWDKLSERERRIVTGARSLAGVE
jgi:hypothetical protein